MAPKQARRSKDRPAEASLSQEGRPFHARWLALGVGALAGILALALYLGTLAPTVTFADAGELAAAVYALDVAHPPGFPLYLLLGKLFTLLVPWGRLVQRLNAFSAVCAAAAVGLVGAALAVGLDLHSPVRPGRRTAAPAGARPARPWTALIALAAAGLLATSRTFWEQATLTEVYALNMALAAGLLFLLVLYLRSRDRGDQRLADRLLAGAALLAGLGLGGHLTLLFVAGAVVLTAWLEEGKAFWRPQRLFLWASLFLLGLCVYLYLPLRASAAPPLNWGGVNTLARFWRHVSGKQYQVNFSPGLRTWGDQVGFFLPRLWAEFTPLPLVLIPLGLYRLFRQRPSLAGGSLAGAAVVLFYALSYEIAEDQETYAMLFFLLAAVWMAYGLMQVVEWGTMLGGGRRTDQGRRRTRRLEAGRRTGLPSWVLAGLGLLLVMGPLLAHFPLCDRRAYTYAEAYARDVLDNLPADTLVLTRDWNLFAPIYYLQEVEGARPDVVFVDQELLRRSWYLETLERRFPWLAGDAQPELAAYRAELVKFEEDLPYDVATIQARFQELTNALIETAVAQGRATFITGEAEYAYLLEYGPVIASDWYLAQFAGGRPAVVGGVGGGYAWVPQALAFRLVSAPPAALPEEVFVQPALGDGRYHDDLTSKTVVKYAHYWLWKGLYTQATVGCTAAVPFYERALAADPTLAEAQAGLDACRP
jgi:hypothetical protein